jgi:hypothetical protein
MEEHYSSPVGPDNFFKKDMHQTAEIFWTHEGSDHLQEGGEN